MPDSQDRMRGEKRSEVSEGGGVTARAQTLMGVDGQIPLPLS